MQFTKFLLHFGVEVVVSKTFTGWTRVPLHATIKQVMRHEVKSNIAKCNMQQIGKMWLTYKHALILSE